MQLTSPTVTVLFFASQRIWHGILRGYCTPGLLLRKPAGLRIELDAASSNVVFSSCAFCAELCNKKLHCKQGSWDRGGFHHLIQRQSQSSSLSAKDAGLSLWAHQGHRVSSLSGHSLLILPGIREAGIQVARMIAHDCNTVIAPPALALVLLLSSQFAIPHMQNYRMTFPLNLSMSWNHANRRQTHAAMASHLPKPILSIRIDQNPSSAKDCNTLISCLSATQMSRCFQSQRSRKLAQGLLSSDLRQCRTESSGRHKFCLFWLQ